MANEAVDNGPLKGPVEVKEAVKRAADHLHEVFAGEDVRGVRLEEVEFVDEANRWIVTLSFLRPIPDEERPIGDRNFGPSAETREFRREYKSVHIDSRTGKADAIRMRSPV